MVNIRSTNEIVLSLIDFFRLAQPNLDVKPGTVARDLFIDAPANQLSLLYDELASISNKQSLRLVVGSELDRLAKNFGIIRRRSSTASGVALLTFSSITAPIGIKSGDTILSTNGFSFAVSSSVSVSPTASNFYRSVATKYRTQLDLVGISDEYAVEVTVTATAAGAIGNIGSYYLNSTSIPGISNVTNINPFTGGSDQEDDVSFRNRTLSAFSGSSVGTSLGYLNTALGTTGVSDAVVIEPGDSLMTRDGTTVKINTDGSRTVISEGSGGKVDVVVLGSSLIDAIDSYIYIDKSNNNDPTSSKNNIVLGQISGDSNKTINRKRLDNIASGILPKQPVNGLMQITGSLSGSNFKEKTTDSYGRTTGNYELIKDTGAFGGCPWGFDTFHWISDRISLYQEDRVKTQFNGQDNLSFTDVSDISKIQQFVSITNENSTVTSDRSVIQLLHYPATNITRVFNIKTGERYIVTNQNLDATGLYNDTGRIKISGNTLPSPSDTLQVDYNWIITYDPHSDFDGLANTNNIRAVTDSIDWGYASLIKNEETWFNIDSGNNVFVGTVSHPISSIISAQMFSSADTYVETISSGLYAGRLAVIINNAPVVATTVESVTLKNSNTELYDTDQANGTIINEPVVVGISLLYRITIILPTDCPAQVGTCASVYMNSEDVYYSTSTNGSFSSNQITIPTSLITTTATSILLRVNYIAAISDLFSSATTSLSSSRVGNGFNLNNNTGFNNFSITNISKRENATVAQNLSAEYYVDLVLPSIEYSLNVNQIISVIRLSDNLELWNSDNPGTLFINSSGNYQLIFSGYNSPAINDQCLVIYYVSDLYRYQPYSFSNSIINNRIDTLSVDPVLGKFYIPMNKFVSQASGLTFTVFEPNTNIDLFSITDGYLDALVDDATVSSLTVDFSSQADIITKKVRISGATDPNNNGVYDISSYVLSTNKLVISNILDNINVDQVSIIRIADGKELWNYSGLIDTFTNRFLLDGNISAFLNDPVYTIIYNYKNLRKAQTRLICTTVDQTLSTGVITINGLTMSKAENIIFTATHNGLQQNLAEALRTSLDIGSSTSLPTNIKLSKLVKLEKVTTVSSNSNEIYDISATYDVKNTYINSNTLDSEFMNSDSILQNTEFILPSTQNNTITSNMPITGDKLRATFYYITENDLENLSYTKNGTLYTNKKFALINKIYISSGFRTSQSTRFTVASLTQPTLGARYKAFYDYMAPKTNERISIKYNYNQLITNVTLNLENTRPINADVLAREAKTILLDLTMNVVILDTYKSSETTVLQNLRNQLTTALTSNSLGAVVDNPTLINIAQSVKGISRARILYFNKTGVVGQLLKIQAQKDEFFAPNTIILNTETR
jgi:hypothetical protein